MGREYQLFKKEGACQYDILKLRIDNSGRSMICAFYHTRKSMLGTITYDVPNKRECFSLTFDRSVIYLFGTLGI